MADDKKLDLVLLWHMHQPDLRDPASGEFSLPWIYLHAIKDYTDMAAHLERHPKMRAAVNLVPVLLDQLEQYAQQFGSGEVRDPLLSLIARPDLSTLAPEERRLIVDRCFHANHRKMIEPFAPYKRLYDIYQYMQEQGLEAERYLSSSYLGDLLVWYHLSWTGETVRRSHELIPSLMAKGERFSFEDRRALFDLIGSLIGDLLPRYRRLSESGQVEISTTPHYHPIGPLLLDLRSAHQAQPELPLPDFEQYPGGRNRLRWHIDCAMKSHARRFGAPPRGMWPAEGAISSEFLATVAGAGLQWAASGEGVLAHSLTRARGELPPRDEFLYKPYRIGPDARLACLFRDDRLSDLIGFEYSKWHGRDAVKHFMAELDAIRARAPQDGTPLVCIMLDGENAWEFYPYNGFYFLDELYEALESRPEIRTWTPSGYLDHLGALPEAQREERFATLEEVVAGSWVYGNFSTWIGSADKNRAWNLLCTAKQGYDLVMASGRLIEPEAAAAQTLLGICEGSDWFWWFGDYNPQDAVATFDRIFRRNLAALYKLLHLPVPDQLSHPVSTGGGKAEMGGAMRRAS